MEVYIYYRPETKLREGNVFMDTCLFTRGWVFLVPCLFFGGYLWYQVPSRVGGYVLGLGGYIGVGMSRGWVTTSNLGRGTWDTMGYAWQAGDTHPTGMLSCCN